jgi:hypothetical protein
MRRLGRALLFGFVWFLILWAGSLLVVGFVIGMDTASKIPLEKRNREQVRKESKEAAERFHTQYGVWFFLGALGIAIVGSATGILPWTKPKRRPALAPPGPDYQYPPYPPGAPPPYEYPQQAPPGQPLQHPQQPAVPPVQYPPQPPGAAPPQYPPPAPQQLDQPEGPPPQPRQV